MDSSIASNVDHWGGIITGKPLSACLMDFLTTRLRQISTATGFGILPLGLFEDLYSVK